MTTASECVWATTAKFNEHSSKLVRHHTLRLTMITLHAQRVICWVGEEETRYVSVALQLSYFTFSSAALVLVNITQIYLKIRYHVTITWPLVLLLF